MEINNKYGQAHSYLNLKMLGIVYLCLSSSNFYADL